MLTIYFSGAEGRITEEDVLTAGMVGRQIRLEFSSEWEGLSKTAVFSNGTVTRDAVCSGDTVTIPAEVLEQPLKRLLIGVYGLGIEGIVIPTVRVDGPVIQPGADPSGDPGLDPELPVWAQIQSQIGDLGELNTKERENLVEAINEAMTLADGVTGATFLPQVSLDGVLTWTNDKGLENPEPVYIRGPVGPAPTIESGRITGGHRLVITTNQKTIKIDLMNGEAGYTPVRGVDYWTDMDQATIKSYVENCILRGEW